MREPPPFSVRYRPPIARDFPPARRWRTRPGAFRACLAILALTWLLVSPLARSEEARCDATNLLAGARLSRWVETRQPTALLTDGAVVPEGATWTSQAVELTTKVSSLTFDLDREVSVGGIYLQGDADASFTLLLSRDAKSWRVVTVGPVPGDGTGLRARASSIEPTLARYVRFGEPSTGHALVTELQLLCELPPALPIHVLARDPAPSPAPFEDSVRARLWSRLTGVPVLTPSQALAIKLALAVLAALLVLVRTPRLAGMRDTALVLVAVASFTGYFNWGAYRFPDYAHTHELFHYVVGGKYFRELGYTRLYDCANVVDAEQGLRARAEARSVRDLRDNATRDGKTSLERASECRNAFTPARWEAFAADVAFFRDTMTPESWDRALRDHGFNPSPAWTMLGSPIANLAPASRSFVGYADRMTAGALARIDPALVALAFVAVAWGFGWRVACVGAVVFGCNPLASFLWTGGAYLREDWFASMVIGLACLKKRHFAVGGACLAYAALLRVFPLALLAPIAFRVGWVAWKERRLERDLARALMGAAVATVVIVGVTGVITGTFGDWLAFAHNTAKLAGSPSVNLVGLRTLLSFRASTRAEVLIDPSLLDPYARVVAARLANFAHALPLYVAGLGVMAALVVRAARRSEEAWVLACIGVAAIPLAGELSCYYSSFLVGLALMLRERPRVPVVLLALCAGLSWLHLQWDDDVLYAYASAGLVAFAAWVLWECGNPKRAIDATRRPTRHDPATRRIRAGALIAAIGAGTLALRIDLRDDPVLVRDGECDARWREVVDAYRAREDGAPDSEIARRRARSVRLAGDDFADRAKLGAFTRVHRELAAGGDSPHDRGTVAAESIRIARAEGAYDESVRAFDAELARAGRPVIERATGRVFEARPTIAIASPGD